MEEGRDENQHERFGPIVTVYLPPSAISYIITAMIRNKPKNSVVPAMKHDMAKRMLGGKLLSSPPHTPRQKSERGGNIVWGSRHSPSKANTQNLTMRKGKAFKHGALGQQEAREGKPSSKVGGGWEISHE